MGKYQTEKRTRRSKVSTSKARGQRQARQKTVGQANKIKVQFIISTEHLNYNVFLAYLTQAQINCNKFSLDIKTISNTNDILSIRNTGQFVVYMPRFCGINLDRLHSFLQNKDFVYAANSTYWGTGYPYIAIFKNINTLKKAITAVSDESKHYFTDMSENILFAAYQDITKIDSFKTTLATDDKTMLTMEKKCGILRLDDVCYLQSEGIEGTIIENSIFACWNDNGIDFNKFLNFYGEKNKEIFYNNQTHLCSLGKDFFVSGDCHFAKINDEIIFWDTVKNNWSKASGNTLKQIKSFLNKHYK